MIQFHRVRLFEVISVLLVLAVFGSAPALGQGMPAGFAGMGEASPDYAQVRADRTLVFPADHQAHDNFRLEWWYVTANLTTPDGTPLGLQWTLFRNALSPAAGEEKTLENPWANETIWMGHAAVTTRDMHYSAERFARGGVGQAGVTGASGAGSADSMSFAAWIDDWTMANPDDPSIKTLDIKADGDGFAYDVRLSTGRAPVLQGNQGYSIKAQSGEASHYYSQPFYTVSGTVTIDGKPLDVTGKAWLDREWSSQFLNAEQAGWDWFSLHLKDGRKVMLFRLRGTQDGEFYSGNVIEADGTTTQVPRGGITITPIQRTRIKGRAVPTGWRVQIPTLALDVETRALNRRAMMETLFSYWEGPIDISGSHSGVGYLEMTGY
ncbi:MAG: lipocalin-like domain-containing protein [Pseudomonadota bacterium]